MRVKLEMVVNVDADAWAETYGIPKDEVREDVRAYFLTNSQDCGAVSEGLALTVTRSI